MRKLITVASSFMIMLCIGSAYAWSIIAAGLIEAHGFSAFQAQLVFGTLIAVFPVTMIFVGQAAKKVKYRYLGFLSGFLFLSGYLLASFSQGGFLKVLLGIGVLAGIATGFGYWVALTVSLLWFPQKKGLITGISAAGFGLGAVFMSEISEMILTSGRDVLELLGIIGVSYGLIIVACSNFIHPVQKETAGQGDPLKTSLFIRSKSFRKLFLGIFLGTFAGLLIIGSLGIIGDQFSISSHNLVHGVALFAMANFLGRLIWGLLSDYLGASCCVFLALLLQSISILSLIVISLTDNSYLILAFLIGFGFGGNFVLFAKETAQAFGVNNMGLIYPYVFLGYAIAGITGPISGGFLYDYFGSFSQAVILSSLTSLAGSLLFFPRIRKGSNLEKMHFSGKR